MAILQMSYRILYLIILLIAINPAHAFLGFGKDKEEKPQENLEKSLPVINLNQELTKNGNSLIYEQSETISTQKYLQKDQEQKAGSKPEEVNKKTSKTKEVKQSSVEKARQELKENEKRSLEFIFPNIEDSQEALSKEKFFSKTEKEQLLELWRATLARNRTIQFIIKSLSANPNEYEKNNLVMQALSKALFVPFYAVAAVTDNSLVSGGTNVGARVIGDIVEAQNQDKDRNRDITRTDLIVLFMLVDEVANRLRSSYFTYKEARTEKKLIEFELIAARLDASEALTKKSDTAIFFTRMVLRDLERRERVNKLNYANSRRNLIELAGEEAVDSVDLLIDLEVEESMQNVLGV